MSDFHFANNRTACPACGARRAFASIIGEPQSGKCFACGVFISPGNKYPTTSPCFRESPKPHVRLSAINPVRRDEMLCSLHRAWYSEHQFLRSLRTFTSPHHIRRSPIGLEPDGSILFWYIGKDKTVWNAKRIMYVGFHRARDKPPHYIYRGNPTPLFGEWQTGEENAKLPVALVESEKTAVVMSFVAPDKLWLATGGASSLSRERASALAGRMVQIFPDADEAGLTGAAQMQRTLEPIAKSASIIDTPLNR